MASGLFTRNLIIFLAIIVGLAIIIFAPAITAFKVIGFLILVGAIGTFIFTRRR